MPITAVPARQDAATIHVAAAGDIHCRESQRDTIVQAFAALQGRADLLLLAGDLTNYGEPEEGAVLADACAQLSIPVYAVLGNHDWHANRIPELTEAVQAGGVTVLERAWDVCCIKGHDVGVVGVKGFVGGFAGSHLPDFGEPLLRDVYRETQREVDALDEGLKALAPCDLRLGLLHYAPTVETLIGESEGIHAFLGTDRLAGPIRQHEPDLVVHGHAHSGTFESAVGGVPVYNVSIPVMGQPFWVFDVPVDAQRSRLMH
jgi:Icc-related predicted phosphoesterase